MKSIALPILIASTLTGCTLVPGSDAFDARVAEQTKQEHLKKQYSLAANLQYCAEMMGDKPAYDYAIKWRKEAKANLGYTPGTTYRYNDGVNCIHWINKLRLEGTI